MLYENMLLRVQTTTVISIVVDTVVSILFLRSKRRNTLPAEQNMVNSSVKYIDAFDRFGAYEA